MHHMNLTEYCGKNIRGVDLHCGSYFKTCFKPSTNTDAVRHQRYHGVKQHSKELGKTQVAIYKKNVYYTWEWGESYNMWTHHVSLNTWEGGLRQIYANVNRRNRKVT